LLRPIALTEHSADLLSVEILENDAHILKNDLPAYSFDSS